MNDDSIEFIVKTLFKLAVFLVALGLVIFVFSVLAAYSVNGSYGPTGDGVYTLSMASVVESLAPIGTGVCTFMIQRRLHKQLSADRR